MACPETRQSLDTQNGDIIFLFWLVSILFFFFSRENDTWFSWCLSSFLTVDVCGGGGGGAAEAAEAADPKEPDG